MIKIGGSGPRLVQLKLCEILPAYIALSHCWGSSNASTLKALSTNIQSFQSAIPFGSLPATFSHAIEVAKSLGFEYIWIDSLCIIQDSLLDWEEQSSLMAFIYSNADVVLAASSATSTNSGFLTKRTAYRESVVEIGGIRDKTHTIRLKYRLLIRKNMYPVHDPLDSRAWALQERLLARRYLAFGTYDISWTCMDSLACECEWWRVATIWRQTIWSQEFRSIKSYLKAISDDELRDCWRQKILDEYFWRELSHQSDTLFALSAIASMFATKLGVGYLAGLWREDLPFGLLWINQRPGLGYINDPPSNPSWSWASLPLHGFSMSPWSSRGGEFLTKVLEASTRPSTVNQFGSVSGGFIKLLGELWNIDLTARSFQKTLMPKNRDLRVLRHDPDLRVNGLPRDAIRFRLDTSLIKTKVILPNGARGATLRRIRLDEVQEKHYIAGLRRHEVVHLFMLPVVKECGRGPRQEYDTIFGLLLVRSSRRSTSFERIGHVYFTERRGNQLGAGAPHVEKMEQEIIMI